MAQICFHRFPLVHLNAKFWARASHPYKQATCRNLHGSGLSRSLSATLFIPKYMNGQHLENMWGLNDCRHRCSRPEEQALCQALAETARLRRMEATREEMQNSSPSGNSPIWSNCIGTRGLSQKLQIGIFGTRYTVSPFGDSIHPSRDISEAGQSPLA